MFTTYAKATCAAIIAGLTAATTAALDSSITLGEGIAIALAFFIALGTVWAVPNRP